MKHLLSAEFARFRRSIFLWAFLLLGTAYGVLMLLSWRQTNSTFLAMGDESRILHPEDFLFPYTDILSYLIAGFAALYLWREFSSGGVRNKIAHGISRTEVYLSLWAAVSLCVVLMCTLVPVVSLIFGLLCYGPLTAPVPTLLIAGLGTVFSGLALASLFTAIAVALDGSPFTIVACVVPAAAMQTAANNTAVYILDCEFTGIRDARYAWCRFWYGILPTGQLMDYRGLDISHFLPNAVRSLALAAMFAAIGIQIFRRRELK